MAFSNKIRFFTHVPFEGPGIIADWARDKDFHIDFTRFHEGDLLPDEAEVDFLVIMGGPMNVFDFHVHPWMQEELEWVARFIESGKPVLGICLGAQIIAAALEAEVHPGQEKEIGWHNVQFLPALGEYRIWKDLPAVRKVFHWHGDTFPIPEGATRIASSKAFPNQGFIYGNQVVALQFHLEVTPESVRELVNHCREELMSGPFIQPEKEILEEQRYYKDNQKLLYPLLDYLSGQLS